MPMRWLMTIAEKGTKNWGNDAGAMFEISPRWISAEVGNDAPPPNPHLALKRWPTEVEVRRPDGTRCTAGVGTASAHFNYAYESRNERDEQGRFRNAWADYIVFGGVTPDEVPIGSEIWGDVADEDIRTRSDDDPWGFDEDDEDDDPSGT